MQESIVIEPQDIYSTFLKFHTLVHYGPRGYRREWLVRHVVSSGNAYLLVTATLSCSNYIHKRVSNSHLRSLFEKALNHTNDEAKW